MREFGPSGPIWTDFAPAALSQSLSGTQEVSRRLSKAPFYSELLTQNTRGAIAQEKPARAQRARVRVKRTRTRTRNKKRFVPSFLRSARATRACRAGDFYLMFSKTQYNSSLRNIFS